MLRNFSFDGKIKPYLMKLPFEEARIIFMFRARMFPTRTNFPNRWSSSGACVYCCKLDTDEHLFKCCGYEDCYEESINYEVFLKLDCSCDELSDAAKVLLKIYERMKMVQEDGDVNVKNK